MINAEWTNADTLNFKPYTAYESASVTYSTTTDSCIDTSTTYIHIPDNDDALTIVCGGEQITILWKDLFKLLKWAYGQGMGGWMLGVLRASCEHHLCNRHDEGRGDCRMEQESVE